MKKAAVFAGVLVLALIMIQAGQALVMLGGFLIIADVAWGTYQMLQSRWHDDYAGKIEEKDDA